MKHSVCNIERLVILFIGWFALFGLGGLIYLVNSGKTPEGHIVALVGVVSAAIGGLVGMLTSLARGLSGQNGESVDVNVTNTRADAVPTTVEEVTP